MPIKFKPSQTVYVKGKGKVTTNYYIKNTPTEELIKYIKEGQKPKIKQKARNELVRRGVNLVWVSKDNDK